MLIVPSVLDEINNKYLWVTIIVSVLDKIKYKSQNS